MHLAVAERFRGYGIGTELFKRAISDMQHCSEVGWRADANSINFYKRLGAVVSKPDPSALYLDGSERTVHMHIKFKKHN